MSFPEVSFLSHIIKTQDVSEQGGKLPTVLGRENNNPNKSETTVTIHHLNYQIELAGAEGMSFHGSDEAGGRTPKIT